MRRVAGYPCRDRREVLGQPNLAPTPTQEALEDRIGHGEAARRGPDPGPRRHGGRSAPPGRRGDPDDTLEDATAAAGVSCGTSAKDRAMSRFGSREKKSLRAAEQDHPNLDAAKAWRA